MTRAVRLYERLGYHRPPMDVDADAHYRASSSIRAIADRLDLVEPARP